jgi:hypothetical protein
VINRWGGTVLEHAGHGFQHGPFDVDFMPTFVALLAAGAKILAKVDRVCEQPVN